MLLIDISLTISTGRVILLKWNIITVYRQLMALQCCFNNLLFFLFDTHENPFMGVIFF